MEEKERKKNVREKSLVEFWGVGAQKVENINEWINNQREEKDVCVVW